MAPIKTSFYIELYIENIKQLSYSAFNEIEQILYESELLSNFVKNPPPVEVIDGDKNNSNAENQKKRKEMTHQLY